MFGWGQLATSARSSTNWSEPLAVESLNALGELTKIVCSQTCLVALTRGGKVYKLDQSTDAPVTEVVPGLSDKDVVDVASHPAADHFLALTTDGDVYSWGDGEQGQLGQGGTRSAEENPHVSFLFLCADVLNVCF